MTLAVAPTSGPIGARRVQLRWLGRLLSLELRRTPMLWMLVPIAALCYLSVYRPATALPPLWTLRAATMQLHALLAFGPLAAGAAAWTGSREDRRDTTDLVTVTARPRWTRQLAAWAATSTWTLAAYAVCVAVVYGVTAAEATWGGPLWWPVAVDAAAITFFCSAGLTAGAFFPSRFIAPITAVVAAAAVEVAFRVGIGDSSPYALVLPAINPSALPFQAGIFYRYLPDLSIAQVLLLAGAAAAAVGVLGLPRAAGGTQMRISAAALAAAGLAAAGTGIGLAGTARPDGHAMFIIPALHDAADNRPVPYTLACSKTAIPICLHPAFAYYLPGLSASLARAAAEIAGLPGVPDRLELVAAFAATGVHRVGDNNMAGDTAAGSAIGGGIMTGSPPVLRLPVTSLPGIARLTTVRFDDGVVEALIQDVIPGTDPAQEAVQGALIADAGIPVREPGQQVTAGTVFYGLPTSAYEACTRFAALPAAVQRSWLAKHLAALQAGEASAAQLP
jgi:hypothetical protein